MTEPLYPSRKLSWEEVSRRIQDQLESLLGRPLSCRVFLEDLDYWGLANDTVFTQTEVERLLRATGAGRDEWQENLYPDEEESKSLGMGLSPASVTASSPWELGNGILYGGKPLAAELSHGWHQPDPGAAAAWSGSPLGGTSSPGGTVPLF